MGRTERIERGYRRTKKVIDRMLESKSLDDVKEVVEITDKLSLEVNCERADDGAVYGLEVYAVKAGQTVDVATMTINNDIEQDIKYLLNCYI